MRNCSVTEMWELISWVLCKRNIRRIFRLGNQRKGNFSLSQLLMHDFLELDLWSDENKTGKITSGNYHATSNRENGQHPIFRNVLRTHTGPWGFLISQRIYSAPWRVAHKHSRENTHLEKIPPTHQNFSFPTPSEKRQNNPPKSFIWTKIWWTPTCACHLSYLWRKCPINRKQKAKGWIVRGFEPVNPSSGN